MVALVAAAGLSAAGLPGPRQDHQRSRQETDFDKKLADMGYTLPTPAASVGVYRSVVVVDNLAWLAGHIPRTEDGQVMRGKVGDDIDLATARTAARRSGLAMLASLKAELGTLNRVKRLVKTTGMVNCTVDFTEQPQVINGCSELIRDLFGDENGVGARSAVGMSSLPAGAIVEIEAVFEITD
jgi:enamine deaminase RidA (YjgF/YER057c/UK114 family)